MLLIKNEIMFFDRDIRKIPCFRESGINGIMATVGGLVLVLMATSRPGFAVNCAFGSGAVVTTGSFFYCNYKIKKAKDLLIAAKERSFQSDTD